MKQTVITIAAVLSLAASPVLAENWHVVSRSSATVFMLDVDSITEAGDARTAVLARVPSAGPSADLSYSAGEITIRCAANQSKPGVEILYGPDGAEQERIDDGYDFDAIAKNSLDAYVKSMLCDGDRGTTTHPSIRAFIEAGRPQPR
ncbi:hypothetical protein D8I30_04325 [Brevundimonas naejangsanensis]|uniref:Uncharacterized protein n=1 Tax=Brevundimonas naejangsanensis TaxID=588932 RepID=A0A494RHC4_9CAUL|nr:hypothetical protein [Brevundimonas naejangsanensis]AYG94493.1 hypothetical protein D8I30_04325 [Brevundimonas naejangsanensis]